MKSTEYIEWDKLEQIPFCLCRIAEDEENQEIDVYYLDKRVCHDYDHVGHYFRTAIIMFRRIRNITADWVNLKNLWLLRDCIRENFNHGLEVDDLIFGETFDGEDPETIKPLTKERLFKIKKVIQEKIHTLPYRGEYIKTKPWSLSCDRDNRGLLREYREYISFNLYLHHVISEFCLFFCNTRISKNSDMAKSWATFCCSGTLKV